MLFIVIDVTAALSHVLNYFGLSEKDAPTARIINMETGKKFSIPTQELTIDSLRQLCQEVVDGTSKVTRTHTQIISSHAAGLNPAKLN